MKGFFSRPYEFSFKDVLAIAFSGYFLFCANRAAAGNLSAMEVVKIMIPLVSIILAGYFGQEALEAWKQRKYDLGINEQVEQTPHISKPEGVRTDERVQTNTLSPI